MRASDPAVKSAEHRRRFRIAGETAKWAVTMTKVRIRQAVADNPWPRWHFVTFLGRAGRESRGVIDLIAVRKDHRKPGPGLKRGDALQIVLIQVKGGSAAKPKDTDALRLKTLALRYGSCGVVYAAWKKGAAAQFFSLDLDDESWNHVTDLKAVFG